MNNRPQKLIDFNGQSALVSNLQLFVDAAKSRHEPLDHVIFHGPPGLGKTTLAQLMANEMDTNIIKTSAPVIETVSTLMSIVSSLDAGDILFIDEIHRLPMHVEEALYTIMEDFRMDLLVGEGVDARSVSIDLDRFTLVGATTRLGGLSRPLSDRFQISLRLDYYDIEAMKKIISRSLSAIDMPMDDGAVSVLAGRCRGTPRIANRLISRIRDFADAYPMLGSQELVEHALSRMGVVDLGLDGEDMRYLEALARVDRPMGLSTISAAISETTESIEDVIEPFLLRQGLLSRTSRGRELTDTGKAFVLANRSDQQNAATI